MPIDPNISLSGVKRTNPLQMAGEMAQMQYNMLQSQGMQQQIDANIATSQALKDAVGPDGQIDYNKAKTNMARGSAAYNLPAFNASLNTANNQEMEFKQKQWDLANHKLDATYNILASSRSPEDLTRNMATAVKQGILTYEEAAPHIQEVQATMGNPQAFQDLHQGWTNLTLDTKDRLAQIQFQPMGNQIGVMQTNQGAGPVGQIGSLPIGLSPDQQLEQVKYIGPNGAPMADFKGNIASQMGQQGMQPNQGAPSQGMPPQMPQGFQVGLAPGQEAAAEGAVKRYNAAIQSLPQLNNTMQGLDEAMRVLPDTISGPGSSPAMWISGIANTFGFPIAGKATKNYEELGKYLSNQGANAAASAGFTGSADKLESFGGGQPNRDTMLPEPLMNAMRFIQAQNKGQKAFINAQSNFLQNNNNNYSALPKFEAEWGKAYNPNVMYLKSLETPEAKAEFLNRISDAQRKSMMNDMPKMAELGAFQ